MGLKGLLSGLGMNGFAQIGLTIFFCVFVAVVVWAWSRPRHEVEAWARIPVEDED